MIVLELFLAKSIIRGNVVNGKEITSELVYGILVQKYGSEKANEMMKDINLILITKGHPKLIYRIE